MKKNGIYLNVHSASDKIKVTQKESINELKMEIESGRLKTVIDKIYPFEKIVEAHRYVDLGHKKGNVSIKIR